MDGIVTRIGTWLSDPTLGRIATAVVSVAVIVLLVRLLQRGLAARIRDSDARYRARKAIGLAGYLAAFLAIAIIYSARLGGMTVALGVAGAGIAFALQEVIGSFAGWLALSFSSFYRAGDRVQLGGIKGDVIDIGVLRTTLMELGQWVDGDLYNGRIVRVANSFVFKEPVFNYSGDFPFLWDEIRIPVRYGSDRRLARSVIETAATEVVGEYVPTAEGAWKVMVRRYMIEDASVEPRVTLIATDNWLEYTLRYVVDYRRRRMTQDALFNRILELIDGTQGRVRFASTTMEVVGVPPVHVVRDDTGPAPASRGP
ncbi:MAG: mechanosensitive ion channel [Gemmatimonadales bacterium]|nr:MAG: mechanosensitive ion channel [Gemmatimonadales bacterium]